MLTAQLHEIIRLQRTLLAQLESLATALERGGPLPSPVDRPTLLHIESCVREVWQLSVPLATESRNAVLVGAREVFALLAHNEFGHDVKNIAVYLKQHRSTVSYTLTRTRSWLGDKDFVERLWNLKQYIIQSYEKRHVPDKPSDQPSAPGPGGPS